MVHETRLIMKAIETIANGSTHFRIEVIDQVDRGLQVASMDSLSYLYPFIYRLVLDLVVVGRLNLGFSGELLGS